MSAVIVGSPASSASASNAKVLRRQIFGRDQIGLETLSETYIVRTENLLSLLPDRNALHKDFSTAVTKYSRMAVQTLSFSEIDGGLSEMNVQFVGLTSSSGLPKATVRCIPTTGAGIYGPPFVIEAMFVTDSNEAQLIEGRLSSITSQSQVVSNRFGLIFTFEEKVYLMPSAINNEPMPPNPRAPFNRNGGYFTKVYYGYVQDTVQTTRRGLFNVANITYKEKETTDYTILI
jgi:hypothetical protein